MFLDESSNGAVFTESTITNIYKTLNEANEEYARLAIKMCKYEHQAILTEDTALLEEAKESFGEKVKKVIQKIWESIKRAFAAFKNWLRTIIVKVSGANAARMISDKLLDKVKNLGNQTITIQACSKKLYKNIVTNSSIAESMIKLGADAITEKSSASDVEAYEKLIFEKVDTDVKAADESKETATYSITYSDLVSMKTMLKDMGNAMKETAAMENKARKAYASSLSSEDKEAVAAAAKISAITFKIFRKIISSTVRIISAVKRTVNAGK